MTTSAPIRRVAGTILAALSALILIYSPAKAQQEPKRRPKIGLVLSGGWSLGLAHLGVLRWLEEHQIPVDVVAGASMGGLVGGLFATGRNIQEREAFVRSIDWDVTLATKPMYRDLIFRRKEDRRAFPTRLEFGVKKGIRLPPALSSGHGVGLVLSRIAAPYADMRSFDDLPTPFRCVGVDLIDGTEKVFSEGSLFDALRSTMSIPGLFPAWEVNGRLYVDGGMVNNLPVNVAKDMGAEVIIAVPLLEPRPSRADLETILGVAVRTLSIMVDETEKRNARDATILIEPDAEDLAGNSFEQWSRLEQLGYDAAERKARELMKYSIGDSEWERYLADRRSRGRLARITPAVVTLDNSDVRSDRLLQHYVTGALGRPFNDQQFGRGLTRMAGTGRYRSLDYSFGTKDGREMVHVRSHDWTHAPPFLNMVLDVDGASGQKIRFGIGARLTFLDFGAPGSEWRTDANIGTVNLFATEYYWRIVGTRWFLAPRASLKQEDIPLFADTRRSSEYESRESQAGADLGYVISRFGELRAGYEFDRLKTTVDPGGPINSVRGDFHAFRVRAAADSHDTPLVPKEGARAIVDFRRVFRSDLAGHGFNVLDARGSWARRLTRTKSVVLGAAGGARPASAGLFPHFAVGGTNRVASLAKNQLLGSRFYYGGGTVLHALRPGSPDSLAKFYLGLGYELGRAYFPGDPGTPYHSGNLSVVAETPLGVLTLGGAVGDKGERKFFFRLGRFF